MQIIPFSKQYANNIMVSEMGLSSDCLESRSETVWCAGHKLAPITCHHSLIVPSFPLLLTVESISPTTSDMCCSGIMTVGEAQNNPILGIGNRVVCCDDADQFSFITLWRTCTSCQVVILSRW